MTVTCIWVTRPESYSERDLQNGDSDVRKIFQTFLLWLTPGGNVHLHSLFVMDQLAILWYTSADGFRNNVISGRDAALRLGGYVGNKTSCDMCSMGF